MELQREESMFQYLRNRLLSKTSQGKTSVQTFRLTESYTQPHICPKFPQRNKYWKSLFIEDHVWWGESNSFWELLLCLFVFYFCWTWVTSETWNIPTHLHPRADEERTRCMILSQDLCSTVRTSKRQKTKWKQM